MTIDLRAGALNVSGYPGNEHTLTLTWPAGTLTATTWEATIDDEPIDSVTVDGDDLVLEFTIPAITARGELVLTQTNVTPAAVKAVGRVRSTETATQDQDSTNLTVTLSTAEGTVTVIGTGQSGSAGADGVSDGDKGDVVVSGDGSVWTLEPITAEKLAFDPATQAELDAEVTARAAADTALDGRLDTIEGDYLQAADITGMETTAGAQAKADAAQAAAIQRANHTGTQTSATISDFTEAVQDAVAALLGEGSNVTLTYNDAAGTLTIDATGGGGSYTDEEVRDAIGVALVGAGLVSVTPNDALDTITITTTATANSTDAALRDRSTHTGSQTIATITGLQDALDAKQPLDADLTALAAAGNSATLAATTAAFTTAKDTKLTGIETGATADQTAAELLTAIKTVDGTGSGLDADLLDGLEATAFAVSSGQYDVNTVGASGSTETLPATHSAHRVTMDQSCTFTFTSPTKTGHTFLLWLSGAFTPTFPASVDWNAATPPTYATPSLYGFTTLDGGTTWAGTLIASGLA